MPKPKPFATEADLCAAFIEAVGPEWTAYAETGGWDILLVRKADGFQVGVQAKLKMNVAVVDQAIEENGPWRAVGEHPDCRAVLVPRDAAGRLDRVCAYVGLTVVRMRTPGDRRSNVAFTPALPDDRGDRRWHETATVKRHDLPAYVPDVRAGAPSPLQLTQWKIKAIKIAVLLEDRGYITRRDFSHLQLDHRRWVAMRWIRVEGARYVADERWPNFKQQHPKVYGQIRDDLPEWAPKETQLDLVTPAMLPL